MPRTKLSQENYRPISFIMFIKLSVQSLSSIHFSCSVVSNSLWSHESTPGFAMAPARHESVPVVSDSLWSLAARQASLSNTNSRSLLKLMSIESVMPSNHIILCCPLLLPPWIFPSIRVFSNESVLCQSVGGQSIGVSASASVLPMNIQDWFPLGLTGWISFQIGKEYLKAVYCHPAYLTYIQSTPCEMPG